MSKLPKVIRSWDDLDGLVSDDGKYKVEVNKELGNGWIVPVQETELTEREFLKHHEYLSTHTFYGIWCNVYERTLLRFGFNVRLVSQVN